MVHGAEHIGGYGFGVLVFFRRRDRRWRPDAS
jgi:hypothetical protein